eukprot:8189794-Alexandrium_andersonii.AAC.1
MWPASEALDVVQVMNWLFELQTGAHTEIVLMVFPHVVDPVCMTVVFFMLLWCARVAVVVIVGVVVNSIVNGCCGGLGAVGAVGVVGVIGVVGVVGV